MIMHLIGLLMILGGFALMQFMYKQYMKRAEFLADECYKYARKRYTDKTYAIYRGDRFIDIVWLVEMVAVLVVCLGFGFLLM